MTQLEIYKSFQFMIELLSAESIFLYSFKRRRCFAVRAVAGIASCFLFSYLFPVAAENAVYLSFMFFVLFAWTVAVAYFMFDCPVVNIIFACIAGYTTQHMAYEAFNMSMNLMGANVYSPMGLYGDAASPIFSNPFLAIVYFFIYILLYFLVWFFFARRMEKESELNIKKMPLFFFVVLVVLVDIVLNAVVMYMFSDAGSTYLAMAGLYNIICCLFGLYIQFEIILRRNVEDTLDVVMTLNQKEKAQYEASRENVELINIMCHDMRHRIKELDSLGIETAATMEMEDMIRSFDCTIKTGNEALDVILTEKNLVCKKNNIRMSCVADGCALDFMDQSDIYSLFGNLLDNSIAAAEMLDEERRVIGVNIRRSGDMATLSVYNSYNGKIEYRNGMPVTSSDKKCHGFGMKSISRICEKYNGELSFTEHDGIFDVNMLFFEPEPSISRE